MDKLVGVLPRLGRSAKFEWQLQGAEFVTLLDRLVEREELVFGNCEGIDIDLDELVFLARNVWRAKSSFSETADGSMEKGLTRSMAKLHFTRFAVPTATHMHSSYSHTVSRPTIECHILPLQGSYLVIV